MKPTRVSQLFAVAVLVGALTWVLVRAAYGDVPVLPRLADVTLLLLALAVAYTANSTRARLAGRPGTRPILPLTVARYAALAKSGSLAGAIVGGAWAGVLVYVVPRLEQRAPAADALTSALGLLAALALVLVSLWLERVCRVKDPPARSAAPDRS